MRSIARRIGGALAFAILAAAAAHPAAPGDRRLLGQAALAPLPVPVANNAVAGLVVDGREYVFSFLGLGAGKDYTSITRAAYRYDVARNSWSVIAPVPGEIGRLAATAAALDGRVYIFGGYTVAADGTEHSLERVDVYDPRSDRYTEAAPMPVPVDDVVSGVWRDRLIYLVSGWSERDNVTNVQVFDPKRNTWRQATPIPGPGLFGHAGAIVGDSIVVADGVRVVPPTSPGAKRQFAISNGCWHGRIDPRDPTRIRWRRLAPHPGPPRYRMAAGVAAGSSRVVFVGGAENPYNFDGIGYDKTPSIPSEDAFTYDVARGMWIRLGAGPKTMDHRGLVRVGSRLVLIGGMDPERRVATAVWSLTERRVR